jgi:hypothetical protein
MTDWLPKPGPFFAGVALSFFACVLAGRGYSQRNIFQDDMQRIHLRMSSEVNFLPTPSQLLRLAENRIPANRIGVIVGGSSVLNGVFQQPSGLWSRRLQELLGDRYSVLNVATRSGAPQEYGNWVSEMMIKQRRRVVHISDFFPCYYMAANPAGLRVRDFYWSAKVRGLLLPDWPERIQRLERLSRQNPAEWSREPNPRIMAELDRWLNFNDLWGSLYYLHFGTFYHFLLAPRVFAPLREREDVESVAPPVPERFQRYDLTHEMQIVTDLAAQCKDDPFRNMESDIDASLSLEVLHASVFLMQGNSPYFVGRMTPQLQAQYRENARVSAESLERRGVSVLQGDFLTESDFADRLHLTEQGGAKLAQRMSILVKRKARELYGMEQ